MSTALTVRERLEVLREIASGPVATVYAAERQAQGVRSLVALKVLREDAEPHALERALSIQRQLCRLRQRHLVCATDLATVGGRPALLRPWIEGIDLLDWIEILRETGVEMPGRVICELLRSVAVALDAALHRSAWGEPHPLGVLHRDLKPTNILVGRDGDVRVLDFGAGFSALAGPEGRAAALRAGLTKYVAPERLQGGPAQHASDVYALGILGIELFGRRWLRRLRNGNPAHDRHLAEVVAAMPDPDMRSQTDDRTLRGLLLRMVAWDPDDRPPAVEVAQTLRTLGDRAPGPSLETFVHDHALPYLEAPTPRDATPEAWLGLDAPAPEAPPDEPIGERTQELPQVPAAADEELTAPQAPILPPPPAAPMPSAGLEGPVWGGIVAVSLFVGVALGSLVTASLLWGRSYLG